MNKNSKVLALKYRPQTFNDLIGQDVVAETISNSIKANKVPNACLLYTSDAADDSLRVDLGGRRIIKKSR